MDFKRKMKIRLWIAVTYGVLGLAMIAAAVFAGTGGEFLSSFGAVAAVIGIARIRNYFIITKDEETMQKQKIAESDERNISIMNRAKSVAFTIYGLISGVGIILLALFNKNEAVNLISCSLCLLLIIYCIAYWVIAKKS